MHEYVCTISNQVGRVVWVVLVLWRGSMLTTQGCHRQRGAFSGTWCLRA